MAKLDKLLEKARRQPKSMSFDELAYLCDHYFGSPRQQKTSHRVYKTPWPGDPRVNIQKGKNGEAKAYQVRQALAAIDKLSSSA